MNGISTSFWNFGRDYMRILNVSVYYWIVMLMLKYTLYPKLNSSYFLIHGFIDKISCHFKKKISLNIIFFNKFMTDVIYLKKDTLFYF